MAKNTDFLIISYFTKGTGYVAEAAKLIKSLQLFGLFYYIEPIDNLGNWQLNTYYKATFIKKMMIKFPEKPVVFLDCDAVVQQYPALFENLNTDLGLCYRDYRKFPCGSRNEGKELLSGTIYFRNNGKAMGILNKWIEKNERMGFRFEQKNLEEVIDLNKKSVRIYEFPPTYCQIFDLMRTAGQPVISQMQVSRRLRNSVNMGVNG